MRLRVADVRCPAHYFRNVSHRIRTGFRRRKTLSQLPSHKREWERFSPKKGRRSYVPGCGDDPGRGGVRTGARGRLNRGRAQSSPARSPPSGPWKA